MVTMPLNHLYLGCLLLICIYFISTSQGVKVKNVFTQSNFAQTLEPTGEYMFQLDQDEIFYVDLEKKETDWRLPQFGKLASFDTAGAFQNIAVMKYNLDIWMKRSNNTKAPSDAPQMFLFTEEPVVLGEPNTLICLTTKFFPPVITMSWLVNGEPVIKGVSETDYYPAEDGSFSKFLYYSFIPKKGDIYTCSVEHAGLTEHPTNRFWKPEVPQHESETYENVICGLGLAVGMVGIIAGIVLICKGKKSMNYERGH